MCKIFARKFLIIMVLTVSVVLLCNYALQTKFAQMNAVQDATAMLSEIQQRMEANDREIERLVANLSDNYITRAHALGKIIDQNPSLMRSVQEMQRLADLLSVDEVYVIDADGVMRWGNVPSNLGLDFYTTEQTKPFLPALVDKRFELAQEPRPNGKEGKMFQYIGVARQAESGIVQVGVAPAVLDSALADTTIESLIAHYNVVNGINIVVLQDDIVVADSKSRYLGQSISQMDILPENLEDQQSSRRLKRDGEKLYCVYIPSAPYIFEISFNEQVLYKQRQNQAFVAAISSLLLGTTIIVAIYILLKRRIISDVEQLDCDLKTITAGNLDVVVNAKQTPEMRSLSCNINNMVSSLKRQMSEIAKQAATLQTQTAQLEDSNINILASLNYARKIQKNLLPSTKAFDKTFSDYSILWEPRDVVGGDIYWIKEFEKGTVLSLCDCTGHGTPGALLTMIVATALGSIVTEENCDDTAEILWELEQQIVSILNVDENDDISINDGADLAIFYIPKEGDIVFSSANIYLFICDGESVTSIKGQRISIGDGSLASKEQIKTRYITRQQGNNYYVVSDGLFDQIGGEQCMPFGYNRFRKLILENYGKTQGEITDEIWEMLHSYMGKESRRDDITLLGFKL